MQGVSSLVVVWALSVFAWIGSSLDVMSKGFLSRCRQFSRLVLQDSSRVSAGYSRLLLSCGWASSRVCHVGGSRVRGLLYFSAKIFSLILVDLTLSSCDGRSTL